MINLSICIVSYNTRDYLRRCLKAIYRYTKQINFEVIVVDNASSDGSSHMVAKEFRQVILVENKRNLWYSGGNNEALKRATGKYVLFFNSDAYLVNNAFKDLLLWLEAHPQVGLIEPRQIGDDEHIAPTGSMLNQPAWDAIEMTLLNKLLWWWPGLHWFRQTRNDRRDNWPTEVISGAALLGRKKLIIDVGGFDERLKLYYTDVDLCRKILSAGREIWHVGEVSVNHTLSASTSQLAWKEKNEIHAADADAYYHLIGRSLAGWILSMLIRLNGRLVEIRNL